jgi:sugar phosphate isomerase/epimerase
MKFGLQLYSIRDYMEQGPESTLEAVKEMGYHYAELAGTAGKTAEDFKKILDNVGITPVSAHYGLDAVVGETERLIDEAKLFGIEFVVMPHTHYDDKNRWVQAANALDEAGEKLGEAGITLSYHNHAHELSMVFDGQPVMDLILETAAPENLKAQFDVCWVQVGGADPSAYLKKYAGRCPTVHIKDMAPEGSKLPYTELGQGVVDFDAVFAAAEAAGVQWYIVEQDESETDSLESARKNAAFMKAC